MNNLLNSILSLCNLDTITANNSAIWTQTKLNINDVKLSMMKQQNLVCEELLATSYMLDSCPLSQNKIPVAC